MCIFSRKLIIVNKRYAALLIYQERCCIWLLGLLSNLDCLHIHRAARVHYRIVFASPFIHDLVDFQFCQTTTSLSAVSTQCDHDWEHILDCLKPLLFSAHLYKLADPSRRTPSRPKSQARVLSASPPTSQPPSYVDHVSYTPRTFYFIISISLMMFYKFSFCNTVLMFHIINIVDEGVQTVV